MWTINAKVDDLITVESKTCCIRITGKVLSIDGDTYEVEQIDMTKRYVNPLHFELMQVKRHKSN